MNDKKQPESNMRAHKLSLSRRSRCVKKKASELAVLCDASMCLIQFDQDGQLNTFPEDASEVNNALKRYLHVGEKVLEKRKVSGLTFQRGGDMHENDEGSPSLGDELLDAKSAVELQNFKHVLDVRRKKLEERIKLLKGINSPERKQETSTFLQFYGDGTPFSPDDLQLSCKFSSGEGSSIDEGMRLDVLHPDLLLSRHHIGLAADNVMTDDTLCSSERLSTNSSSYDSGIQMMNNADSLGNMITEDSMCQHHLTHDSNVAEGNNWPLKGDGSSENKKKGAPFQLFYRDGMPCSSDDLRMSINHCGSRSPFFRGHKDLAVYPTDLLLFPFQSVEADTNVAQHGSSSDKWI